MEKFLSFVKTEGKRLKLKCREKRLSSWKFLEKDEIYVEGKGSMKVLRTKGDGNCQFRAVALQCAH